MYIYICIHTQIYICIYQYTYVYHIHLPAVLPKVHHRPEPLYVPSKVNTLQVDRLARIPGLVQASYRRILSNRISFQNLSRLTPLSTNTQDSLVPQVPTLKEVRVREGRGQPISDLMDRKHICIYKCVSSKVKRLVRKW